MPVVVATLDTVVATLNAAVTQAHADALTTQSMLTSIDTHLQQLIALHQTWQAAYSRMTRW